MDVLRWLTDSVEMSFMTALFVAIAGRMVVNMGSASPGDPLGDVIGNLTMMFGKGCYTIAAIFAVWGLILLMFKILER